MSRFLKILLPVLACILVIFIFKKMYRFNDIKALDKTLQSKFIYRGIKNSSDFTFDESGNTYIAFSNKVQVVDALGKSSILFSEKALDIDSIVYKAGKLYYTSDCIFGYYDIEKKVQKTILNNLPNLGDYGDSKLMAYGDNIFITIGTATNSGIVGEDNKWLPANPFICDLSPKSIVVNSKTASKNKTGAFTPYNSKNINGQVISSYFPGNGSIDVYNIKSGDSFLYSWGIRNVTGLDYNSLGNIYFATGGMEDRGTRPVKGDVDYIYQLKESVWYGWPDYSGGDPISSPRFKGAKGERISFVMDMHPTSNPPAPVYQHKNLSALGSLAIDRNGVLGEKDGIYFCDTKDNILYNMNKSGIVKEKMQFGKEILIKNAKFHGNSLVILDAGNGCLISIDKADMEQLNISKNIIYYLLGFIVTIIACLLWKMKTN